GAPAMGVDLPLDRVDVLNGGEIEVLAPEKRPQFAEEGGAGGAIAGHGPRLDQRRALPILSRALVIIERGLDRDRGRRRGRIGPQPQIGAKDVAIGGALVENTKEVACQARETLLDRRTAGVAHAVCVEQQDEIDITGIIELARTKLAHAENQEP